MGGSVILSLVFLLDSVVDPISNLPFPCLLVEKTSLVVFSDSVFVGTWEKLINICTQTVLSGL